MERKSETCATCGSRLSRSSSAALRTSFPSSDTVRSLPRNSTFAVCQAAAVILHGPRVISSHVSSGVERTRRTWLFLESRWTQ